MLDPIEFDDDAILEDGTLVLALGITHATLARARRTGALKYSRKGKRVLYLGRWVKHWIASEATPSGGVA